MRNRRILIYGSLSALLLLGVAAYLFLKLYNVLPSGEESGRERDVNYALYEAVPSDAILVCNISGPKAALGTLVDTTLLGGLFADDANALLQLQKRLVASPLFAERTMLFSLHYSSKRKISFLQIMDASAADVAEEVARLTPQENISSRYYNGATIYALSSGLCYSLYKGRLLLSNSAFVLESSVRHLANGSSILDNREFKEVLGIPAGENSIVLRNSQTGKIFSSIVASKSLKYADYTQKYATWTVATLAPSANAIKINERFVNYQDADCLDYLYSRLHGGESGMREALPANTVVAISYTVGEIGNYLEIYKRYLEANRRLTGFESQERELAKEYGISTLRWTDTLKLQEAVIALCEYKGGYEWITALRCGADEKGLISSLFSKERDTSSKKYEYQGFAKHLFGNIFSNTPEEYYVERDGWRIIGRREFVSALVKPTFKYLSLEEYLNQTEAKDLFKERVSARLYLNLHSYRDTLAKNYLPFLENESVGRLFERNNFMIFAASAGAEQSIGVASTELYCANLPELTMERKIELPAGKSGEFAKLPQHEGPFVLKDFANGGNCTLEQLPDNSLRYTTSLGKAAWTIKFPGKLAGCVEQADLYHNGKLQMMLAHKNMLYAIDRLGRYVKGYPVTLPKEVAYGPGLYPINGGKDYLVAFINEDNTLTVMDIKGNALPGWKDIELEEFIGALPQIEKRGGEYVVLLETYKGKYEFTLKGEKR